LTESHETLNQKMIELKLGKGERLAEAENELHQLRDENVILKKRLIKLIKYVMLVVFYTYVKGGRG